MRTVQPALRWFVLLTAALCQLSWVSKPALKRDVEYVVLDPGHGGHDPGTSGVKAKEKLVALSIALKVEKLLKDNAPDLKVGMTRRTDVFVPLNERAAIANRKKADLFVSIHCNANPNTAVFGTETYAMGLHKGDDNLVVMSENSSILLEDDYQETYDGFDPRSEEAYIIFSLMQNAHLRQSLALAGRVEANMKTTGKRRSRGVKQAGFIVLWKTSMPSVLIETGFLSNRLEEKFMSTEEGQQYIAKAIYSAIMEYRNGK